jgi:hypothetical protein
MRFLRNATRTPYQGPSENAVRSSGRSEKSSLIKDGIMGSENSMYCRTTAMAVIMAVTVSLRAAGMELLVFVVAIK